MKNTINEIRQKFLQFFQKKGHTILPSSSLIPKNDSTLLFTNAGMNQFKDFFLDPKKKKYSRVVTSQRCLRTGGKHNDLENVGYTERHHTFFEMLGNFSFNDYFKKEAIIYAWELLTSKKWFNINKNKLWISVYKDDEETYKIWLNIIKLSPDHIIKIGDKNNCKYNSENFWQMGETGPCGPCTEIFYNYDIKKNNNFSQFLENKNENFIEIWNIVFIEYNRISSTKIIPLKYKSIDTGMGLERIASVLQNVNSNYKIDIFKKLIKQISCFSKITNLNNISLKIISDHIRSCIFLIYENISPSNEHRGYILRRIIRRMLIHAYKIGIKKNFFYKIVPNLIEHITEDFNFLKGTEQTIKEILQIEETQFSETLEKGLRILNIEIQKAPNQEISGKTIFYLYDTFGFPSDLALDICREKKIKVDLNSYYLEKEKQKKQSKIGNKFYNNGNNIININDTCNFEGYKKNTIKSLIKYIYIETKLVSLISEGEKGIIFLDKTCFYPESGGQIGDIGELYFKKSRFIVENTKKYGNTIGHIGKVITGAFEVNNFLYAKIDKLYRNQIQINHSATHLLHSALRKVLGDIVTQKGSSITNTRLRFDFSYPNIINLSKLQKVENIINAEIYKNHLIKIQYCSLEEAKKQKAMALFENKYDSIVRVVSIKNFSIELCGGTHTNRTGNIGLFKIIAQSSVSSGIKRIEALTQSKALQFLHNQENEIENISKILKTKSISFKDKINKLILQIKYLEDQIHIFQTKENQYQIKKIISNIENIKGVKLLINVFNNYNYNSLKLIIDQLKKDFQNIIIIFINKNNNYFNIITGITKNLTNYLTALEIIKIFIKHTNGKGGGKNEIAESISSNVINLSKILKIIKSWIHLKLNNIKDKIHE
ncbi:alanyl-tRNA synthetase [Buchnera aphidicola (Aphis glycines)]|uniref:Alanine--tRNA ligase n=1 Tax=Buchnera aphidicola (Aphis glycines) TaxID=1265350 RepID=A0A0M5JPT9_9GAMM|nr:alanine--tRNA ligase [Buchnera aphidicola]ALD15341.1 alanyl-tRNA synthetase [Buchnera aphidicola (Aphis glycines)]